MPPRKRAATTPEVPHTDACQGPRMESFTATRPDGTGASVVRCQECGAQTTN